MPVRAASSEVSRSEVSTRQVTDAVDTRFLMAELPLAAPPGMGAANLIYQLSHPGVGYGVIESKVDSGNLYKHPVKRARTTLTYLAVAMGGNAQDRKIYRDAVNTAHVRVRSDEASPLAYNAFDPDTQLWVAACLYMAFVDGQRIRKGTKADPDEIYQAASVLGTTLQVPREMWPANRDEFMKYWNRRLDEVVIDDTVREFLIGLAKTTFLPAPIWRPLASWNLFITNGFLPPQLRTQMGFEWTARDERRFERWLRVFRLLDRMIPSPLGPAGMRLFIWDMRFRYITGRKPV